MNAQQVGDFIQYHEKAHPQSMERVRAAGLAGAWFAIRGTPPTMLTRDLLYAVTTAACELQIIVETQRPGSFLRAA